MRLYVIAFATLLPACANTVQGGTGAGGATAISTTSPTTTTSTTDATTTAGAGGGCGEISASGPTECPVVWNPDINDMLPCAMEAGTTCAYPEPGQGWHACTCGCVNEYEFSCYGEFGGPNCPLNPPTTGSSCASTLGISCPYYPSTHCTCLQNGTWQCGQDSVEWPCLNPPAANTSPSGIAPTVPVVDLSTADATAWCNWYVNAFPPGGQLPPDYPAMDGYAWGGATMGCFVGCVQHLKVEHCVANLAISTCAATLGDLEDCTRTIMNQCQRVGHGCAPLTGCGCETTIVQVDDASPDCRVPVE